VSELQQDYSEKLTQAELLFRMGVPLLIINERLGLGLDDVPGGELPFAGRSAPGANGPFDAPALGRAARPLTKAAVPTFGSEDHIARMKAHDDRQEPHIEAMQRRLKKELQRQQVDVLRRLRNQSGQNAIGRGHRLADVKDGVGMLFPLDDEIRAFEAAFKTFVEGMVGDAGALELARLPGEPEDFDIQRPAVQDAIRTTLREMAEKVNQTTYTELVDLFQLAEANGESLPEMAERLSAYFEGRKSDYETLRIARTTMVGADNAGALEAYNQSGVVSQVAWLAALDDRVRPAHEAAHGQQRFLGELFDVGGEALRYPGDPKGAAKNIINCRCAVMPIVE
jgi:hypothetical protein